MKVKTTVVKWTLVIVMLPLITFIVVQQWEKYHVQLPVLSAINGWLPEDGRPLADTAEPCHAALSNQNGKTVFLTQFRGKWLVAHFFFSRCPASCPKVMKQMERLQQVFGSDSKLELISLTVDPEYDTPAILLLYGSRYNVNVKNWMLLTGDKRQLYRIARTDLRLTASDGDGGPEDFIHSDWLVLVDPSGQIRGYFNGTQESEVGQLINDIKNVAHVP